MRTLKHWTGLKTEDRGAAVALGNFDGVHLGHQAVIALARAAAQGCGAPLGVVTFEPHPRSFFAPKAPPFRLMNAEARAHRLAKLGVERLYELPFDAELAGMSAETFARDVLTAGLGVVQVVVGNDFRFGKGREGDAAMLAALGRRFGFQVTVADLIAVSAREVSSTAIRRALTEGRPEDAAHMLGHLHRIEGRVLHGKERGRTLGFRTANQSIDGLLPPRFGVYAVLADVLSGAHKGSFKGVASIGVRPMFGKNRPNCETFLFDFSGNLYGADLSVALVAFLRPEMRFASREALVAQIGADCAEARAVLEARP